MLFISFKHVLSRLVLCKVPSNTQAPTHPLHCHPDTHTAIPPLAFMKTSTHQMVSVASFHCSRVSVTATFSLLPTFRKLGINRDGEHSDRAMSYCTDDRDVQFYQTASIALRHPPLLPLPLLISTQLTSSVNDFSRLTN